MPNTRKKIIKTVYQDEDSEEETDFSDSGSDAHISAESDSDDDFQSDASSEPEINSKNKKSKSKKPPILQPKFTKTLVNKINKQNESLDAEPALFTVKDLTEEDKLLPSFLNLSESDSSDDEAPKVSRKPKIQSIKENVQESKEEIVSEYKDVWSINVHDNSEEIAKKAFMELEKHHTKIEETKATIDKYYSAKQEKESDVNDLLALGETVQQTLPIKKKTKINKNKDDSDSDIEDWEEVNEGKTLPQRGLELFVEFPNAVCRKKKKVDVEMMMKRKINRTKKEQQIYLHKVHVLCWIGHGNYVSRVLNDQDLLAAALSLVPSKECYPGERVDMKYLELITTWYKDKLTLKQDKNEDKFKPKALPLKELLLAQIKQKVVTTKKYLVFIFIIMLRALGLQCRVMFNFVTLPLKPPSSDLYSLSTKTEQPSPGQSNTLDKSSKGKKPSVKKATSNKENLSQLDGNDDIKFDNILQVDGSNDESPIKTRNTRKAMNAKSEKQLSDDEDVLPPKIPKKSNRAKTFTKEIKVTIETSKESRKLRSNLCKDDKKVPCKNYEDAKNKNVTKSSTISPKLSLSRRKKDTKIMEKNENKATVPKLDDENSEILQKTRNVRNKTFTNTAKLPIQMNKEDKTEKKLSQKESKLPQIIVSQSDVASEYFNNKPSDEVKKVRASRKRSCSTDINKADESSKKITKTRHKSATEKTETSEYFSLAKNQKIKKDQDASVVKQVIKKGRSKLKQDVTSKVDIKEIEMEKDKPKSSNKVNKGKNEKESLENIDKTQLNDTKSSIYDSDDDFKPVKLSPKPGGSQNSKYDNLNDFKPTKLTPKPGSSKIGSKKKDRRVFSSDDETPKNKVDVWCEVFVEELEQWICVDIIKGKIHDTNSIYISTTHPVCYIVGWDNNNYLKDVTQRYVPHWNTVTRKQRADPEWFNTAIKSWLGPKTARDKEEDVYLDQMQLEAPLPKSISEYKNHPLYALKRHLLKFEALYPPNAATLGFVRGEAVYSRDCVYTCRSREIWLKEAKVVRLGEEPYKIVKARPKWDKLSNKLITDKPLEVFGPWQVDDYVPPVAENGIVPRNAYGNVELFKECMLPKGTVLIKLPGLNKVAKKLNIDCAPAMTGFDYSGGWAHPVFDGFVVCKEFEEIITEAWLKDQEEQERRQQEKIETRVYGNWRKLIKGLLIRERIKNKYGFDDPKDKEVTKNKSKEPRLVVKKKR